MKKCFVLMPFSEKYREVYDEIYKPVCADLGMECWRVDEISRPGSITKDIVEGIMDADVVIADLTSKNPNVFYELGIAHSVGNKTIMVAQTINDVPFDIANYRVIIYEQTISGSKRFRSNLTSAIQELQKALDQTNNPLQEALSSRSTLGKRKQVPLVKYIDISGLTWQMRQWLKENNVVYADDINDIDMEKLINTKGIGKTALRKFLASVVEHDLYKNGEELQRIIVANGIRLRSD